MNGHACECCRVPTGDECGACVFLCAHCWRGVPVFLQIRCERTYTPGQCEDRSKQTRENRRAVVEAIRCAREAKCPDVGNRAA